MIYILAYLDKMYLQLANTNLTPISPFITFPHPLPWPWRNVLTNLTFFDFTSSLPLPMEERIDQYLGTINAPLLWPMHLSFPYWKYAYDDSKNATLLWLMRLSLPYWKLNLYLIHVWIKYWKEQQGSKGIRQWLINWCTSPMIIDKITPSKD